MVAALQDLPARYPANSDSNRLFVHEFAAHDVGPYFADTRRTVTAVVGTASRHFKIRDDSHDDVHAVYESSRSDQRIALAAFAGC